MKIYDKYYTQLIDINDYKNKRENLKCVNKCIIL